MGQGVELRSQAEKQNLGLVWDEISRMLTVVKLERLNTQLECMLAQIVTLA